MVALTASDSQALDRVDPLAFAREFFEIGDPSTVYLDGNSLGRLPLKTAYVMRQAVERDWAERLVRGWNEGWLTLSEQLGNKIGSLVGASAGQVLACDSTSVNLYKLVMSALGAAKGRKKIVTDSLNFPSDLYVLQGCVAQFPGAELIVVPSEDGITVSPEAIGAYLSEEVALLTLSHVAYKSGYLHPMATINALAKAQGVRTLWDLSHSVGVVPIELDRSGADLAIGCGYKYLNGGPGAPAFLYVSKAIQEDLVSPIWGWFGHDAPFQFSANYRPAKGIHRFLAGTPPILSLVALEPGIDMIRGIGTNAIRTKSVAQTEYLISLYDEVLAPLGLGLGSPRAAGIRGSHVSFTHPEAHAIDLALIHAENVIPDFRRPDTVRFGIAPLYTTYSEIEQGVERLARILHTGSYENFRSGGDVVI